jgi:hypothetical protein
VRSISPYVFIKIARKAHEGQVQYEVIRGKNKGRGGQKDGKRKGAEVRGRRWMLTCDGGDRGREWHRGGRKGVVQDGKVGGGEKVAES